jgi:hypothetical protein
VFGCFADVIARKRVYWIVAEITIAGRCANGRM